MGAAFFRGYVNGMWETCHARHAMASGGKVTPEVEAFELAVP